MGQAHVPRGDRRIQNLRQFSGDISNLEYASALDRGFRVSGWRGAVSKAIEVLKAQRKSGYASPYDIAQLYADLGDKEHAFEWLTVAYQERSDGTIILKTLLEQLREDWEWENATRIGEPWDF